MGRKKLTKKEKFVKELKKQVNKVLSNDVVVRASKTALQTFVAVLLLTDNPASTSALSAAGAAALSAAWNTLKEYNQGE